MFNKIKEKNINYKKEDIYISILKLAKEKELEGFDYNDIYDLAEEKKYLSNEELDKIKNNNIDYRDDILKNKKIKLEAIFVEVANMQFSCSDKKSIMSFESYFKLIEHEELSEARKNAREARWLAIIAIIISLISVLLSSKPTELKNPVKLDDGQWQEIQNSKVDISNLKSKLDVIIKNQKEDIELKEISGITLE